MDLYNLFFAIRTLAVSAVKTFRTQASTEYISVLACTLSKMKLTLTRVPVKLVRPVKLRRRIWTNDLVSLHKKRVTINIVFY